MTTFNLTGTAYSPLNSAWPAVGPIAVSFDLSGGTAGWLPGQVLNANVTDFSFSLDGHQEFMLPSATANYYLSPSESGLLVSSPTEQFVWIFSGSKWTAGYGEVQTASVDYNLSLSNAVVSTPEPGIGGLMLVGLIVGWLVYSWRSK